MTRQFIALKVGQKVHILDHSSGENLDGFSYDSAISSLAPNFVVHCYADIEAYTDAEKALVMRLAIAYFEPNQVLDTIRFQP